MSPIKREASEKLWELQQDNSSIDYRQLLMKVLKIVYSQDNKQWLFNLRKQELDGIDLHPLLPISRACLERLKIYHNGSESNCKREVESLLFSSQPNEQTDLLELLNNHD